VTVQAGGASRTLWPYTGTDFRGTAEAASDPINLIFTGHADPRSIRAALLALDGNRPGFPALPFFQCTWTDAMAGNQTAYGEPEGWSGSAIQLECGAYQGLRFHLRLFKVGEWTVGNAHFETIISGTHDHQVLSWELAEQLVAADLARAGVVNGTGVTLQINPQPSFRTIHPLIYYNPEMMPLHPLINAVVDPANPQNVGIRTDGKATILQLGHSVAGTPGKTEQELVINFGQVIPKPFCAGPSDYVYVTGPLSLRQTVNLTPSGNLTRQFHASGELTVTPVNPLTGQPIGPSTPVTISDLYKGMMTGVVHSASNQQERRQIPAEGTGDQLIIDLQVGPQGLTRYTREETCGT
jgi:hypothetical protein